MPITFPTGEEHDMELFITNLDEEYSVVLGYNWLTQYNPAINWVETKIMFWHPPNHDTTLENKDKGVDICLVSAQALGKLCQDPENITVRISVNEALESPRETLDPSHPLQAQRVDGSSINDTQDVMGGMKCGKFTWVVIWWLCIYYCLNRIITTIELSSLIPDSFFLTQDTNGGLRPQ